MKQTANHAREQAWSGYTLDRLNYEKVVTLAAIEIEKERVGRELSRLRQGNFKMARGIFSRLTGIFSYTDYIVLAVKLWKRLAPAFRSN